MRRTIQYFFYWGPAFPFPIRVGHILTNQWWKISFEMQVTQMKQWKKSKAIRIWISSNIVIYRKQRFQKLNNDTNCLSSNSTHILLLFCLLEVVRSYYYFLQQLNKKLDRPLRSISHFCSSCKRRKNNDF